LSKFQDRLKHDFESYFNEFDSFSLQVGEHQLFYSGKVIYESEDVKESLAFVFLRMASVKFDSSKESSSGNLSIPSDCEKERQVNRFEDDLVTLLWEKDFTNLAITTLDDFSEGSTIFVPATEEELSKGLEYSAPGKEGWRKRS